MNLYVNQIQSGKNELSAMADTVSRYCIECREELFSRQVLKDFVSTAKNYDPKPLRGFGGFKWSL